MPNETKLWRAFSLFIRLRDTDENGYGKCFTCSRILNYKDGDCGHGIGRQHKATKYNEKNNHLQCKPCNGFEGGKREIYKKEVDKRYGQNTWAVIEMSSRLIKKRTQFEIDSFEEHFRRNALELFKMKNLGNKPTWLK